LYLYTYKYVLIYTIRSLADRSEKGVLLNCPVRGGMKKEKVKYNHDATVCSCNLNCTHLLLRKEIMIEIIIPTQLGS